MKRYFGRENETADFRSFLQRKTASLVVCQGRRRVGKSTFIKHCAAHADHFFFFEGLPPRRHLARAHQMAAFAERLAEVTTAPRVTLETWPQAFQLLASVLPSKGSTVLLLDEISWMAAGDPDFAGHLKAAWDNQFSQRSRLVLVLCGSVSSWIDENILNNTGFVGRCSREFRLAPLGLPHCNRFWGSRSERISSAEKLKILAVTGGIPRYLEEVDPRRTAEQNIHSLCFSKGALLFREFNQIFHDIFSRKAETYRGIVRTLVDGTRSLSDVSRALKHRRGGALSQALSELTQAGFIRRDRFFDLRSGDPMPEGVRYRLSDNYLRFYLKYVEPVRDRIEKGIYQWVPLESLMAWETILGLQFENLILENLDSLRRKLGLQNVPVINAGPYAQSATQRRKGCQIDMVIRTKHSLYVFEVKFRKHISPSVIDEVKEKVERLKLPRSLSVRTGLVYEGGLDPSIEQEDYFDFLVPFNDLLKE